MKSPTNYLAYVFFISQILIIGINGGKIISPDDFEKMVNESQSVNTTEEVDTKNRTSHSLETLSLASREGSSYNEALEAIFGIGIRLQLVLKDLEPTTKNFLVSPLSTAVAVAQLMLGARGNFRKQLADLLVIDGSDRIDSFVEKKNEDAMNLSDEIPLFTLHRQLGKLLKVLQENEEIQDAFRVKTASALFLQPGVPLLQLFEQTLYYVYDTHIVPVNFSSDPEGSQKTINDWAANSTDGRIQTILHQPAPINSAAILANAVYFKGDWETPFSSEFSKVGRFRINKESSINVTFMRDQFEILYAESKLLNCKMIVLPYKDRKVSMYLILPNENNGTEYDIKNFTTQLKSKDVIDLIDSAQNQSVSVIIPKMTLSNTLSILDPLRKYQQYKNFIQHHRNIVKTRIADKVDTNNKLDILDDKIELFKKVQKQRNDTHLITTDIFQEGDAINLTGASKDPRFKLTDIIQQMTLTVNEKGTEAAVVTAGIIEYTGNTKIFKADRPFLCFIRHEETQAILFWGTIVNPTNLH